MRYDKKVYRNFSDRISSGDPDFLANFLAQHKDLDITYHDEDEGIFSQGEFLILAISGDTRRGDSKITKLLLDYYETIQLPKLVIGSIEYNLLKFRLKTALDTAVEGETLSDEMTVLLSKYLDFSHDEDPSVRDVDVCDLSLEEDSSYDLSLEYSNLELMQGPAPAVTHLAGDVAVIY